MSSQNRQLEADRDRLQGQVERLNRLVFGSRTERSAKILKSGLKDKGAKDKEGSAADGGGTVRKKRSSKGGAKRLDFSHLPVVDEYIEVDDNAARCALPFAGNGYEESELIEIEVKSYRRRIRRGRKQSTCECEGVSKQVVAKAHERLFAHTRYELSVWALFLLERFVLPRTVGGFVV